MIELTLFRFWLEDEEGCQDVGYKVLRDMGSLQEWLNAEYPDCSIIGMEKVTDEATLERWRKGEIP